MKYLHNAAAAALALALVACGGGGGSTPPPSGGGGGGTGGGTPTPSPVTYTKFADLTGTQQFKTGCAGLVANGTRIDAIGFGRFNNDTQLSIDYAVPSQSWTVAGASANGTPFSLQFTQPMLQPNPPTNTVYYLKSNVDGTAERFYVANFPIGGVSPEYMRSSLLNYRINAGPAEWRYCVFGVPTTLADTRPASTVTYTTVVSSIGFLATASSLAQYDLSESTATVSANPVNGQIPVSITLVGRQFTPTGLSDTRVAFGTYSGTASIDGTTQAFTDALRDSPDFAILGGNFGGWFFGPQGREIGMSFSIRATNSGATITAAGTITGRR